MTLSPGGQLGPYEIIGPLGAGGMGEVYRARDVRLGREVAVKVLPPELATDAERLARFEREACSASALNHPNIVTVHDFGVHGGETYLVMELIRGESLREMVSRGPVPQKKLLSIAAGIANGLAAAHAAGIVHRDLKPENVMVTGDGTPKLLDFGLVKSTAAVDLVNSPTELEVSRAGIVVGTATYMSPEQARGEAVDFRSDQFSLGLILHELATGKHAFHRGSSVETLAAILNAEPAPLHDSLLQPFVWIVERCLEKPPAQRYGSTADLAHDLARVRDLAWSGRSPAIAERHSAWVPLRWLPLAAAALVAVLVFAILATRRQQPASSEWFLVDVTTPGIDVHVGEVALPVVISPDGRYLALYGVDADGTHDLWLYDFREGTTRKIAEQAFASAWSSDSRAVAYFAEGKLKVSAVEGGPARDVCSASPEGTPSWHGETILFAQYSREPAIYRVDARGGTPEPVVRAVAPPDGRPMLPWWPQFLPDGRRFLYLTLRPGSAPGEELTHELLVGSVDGMEPRRIATVSSRAAFAEGHLLFVRDGTLLAQPFDAEDLKFTGDARPLLDGLHYFRNTGLAAFSVSTNGLLAWRSVRAATRLEWLDRAGMEVGQVATVPGSDAGRLSPDGKRYVLGIVDPKQGVSDIWVHDLARESPDRVTFDLMDQENPVWGPDGTIYFRMDGNRGPPDIAKLSPGESSIQLVYEGRGVDEPHDVSRDGKWLLFIDSTPPIGADIKVLPLDGTGTPRPFAATPFQELSPRFSPDGRWVSYSSDVSGRQEIYVRAFEGTAAPRRISENGGTHPRWSPDGRELFFLGPGGRLMAASVSAEFGTPRMLFQSPSARQFEVGGVDPTRFLVHLEERSSPAVHVLMNWPARLRGER